MDTARQKFGQRGGGMDQISRRHQRSPGGRLGSICLSPRVSRTRVYIMHSRDTMHSAVHPQLDNICILDVVYIRQGITVSPGKRERKGTVI